MIYVSRQVIRLIVAASSWVLAGCGDDGSGVAPGIDGGTDARVEGGWVDTGDADLSPEVTVTFRANVGTAPFDCTKTFSGLGTGGSTVEPLDFRLYVHDFRLLDGDGVEVPLVLDQDGAWQYQDVALLDFEDKKGSCANGTSETNFRVTGRAPPGVYTGVKFKLGLPAALNHGNAATAPSPLNVSGLFWSWQYGYKFLRADALITDTDADVPPAFDIHVGSTNCTGEPPDGGMTCTNVNEAEVVLTGFDPRSQSIVVDYARLVSGSALATDLGDAPGCMSDTTDPECPPLFSRLGIDLATGQPVDGQTFFRTE